MRITVREGDIDQAGDPGVRSERAELDSGKRPFLDRRMLYRFSVLIPPDFPIVDTRLVIAQWKQDGLSGSPIVAQRFRDGRHYLTIRRLGSRLGDREVFDLPELTTGVWHDMEYSIGYSTGEQGSVQVTMDGRQVARFSGPTASREASDRFYNKFGLYRDRWPDPMTIYFDDYAIIDLSTTRRSLLF